MSLVPWAMRFQRTALTVSVPALLLTACAHDGNRGHQTDNNALCAQEIVRGDLERADIYCDLGLEFSPEYADLWANKGLIALLRRDSEKAKQYLLQALRYNPEHRQAHANLGRAYLEQGAYGPAEEAFRQCLRLEAKDANCLEGLEQARRAAPP